jgi:hypothetical protein
MARIFIDGFESGSIDLWDGGASYSINSNQTGRSGTYCIDLTTSSAYIYKFLPVDDEYYFAFKYKVTGSNVCNLISLHEGSVRHIAITLNSTTGVISCKNSADGEIVASAAGQISINAWTLVEIYAKIADSGGRITIKINGNAACIDFTGDTRSGGTVGTIDKVTVGYVGGYYGYSYFDDFVIDNAAWIGNTKITAISPTGVGATSGWTPSTGSNYECVNEIPYSDTDYIKTSSSQIDTYVMGDLGVSVDSIKSVAVQTRNWRVGNGAYDRGQHIVRPASTDRLATAKTNVFPITAQSFQSIWELNPEDSQAWEAADINGMEAGIKAVTV